MKYLRLITVLSISTGLGLACGEDDEPAPAANNNTTTNNNSDNNNETQAQVPTVYQFESRFTPGETSISYSGQTNRHLLIASLTDYIDGLTDQTFAATPTTGVVRSALMYYYDFENEGGTTDTELTFTPGDQMSLQTTWGDIGSLASLKEKFPEYDADFTGTVIGWGDGNMAPEDVIFDMFDGLEALMLDRINGNIPTDPSGASIEPVYVTAEGLDYKQLIQKYALGAVAYSQGADDYWDDDIEGKGLLSENMIQTTDRPYTALEHVWDEGFGYFGAARNYNDYTDDEIAGKGGRDGWQVFHDTDGDGRIDFKSEYNFGASTNAAKRDRGSAESASTDFTKTAFDAALAGRHLISTAGGNLSEAQLEELRGYRDTALGAWEMALAATVVHYINDTLQDLNADSTDYSFVDHAKHWSELKGFALALQFNVRHSMITTAQLTTLHEQIGLAPVLPNAETAVVDAHKASLNDAKALLKEVYGFDDANLGDADGLNGW